ncbi:MAG: zf-TFIIB domain-containing protein [Colwellia sp.]|nr:zf-TFIIB domain-containing protein [Colwellia sp.]MCW8865227.1 zf-TFIIB domain-containing protein [Colwellia sp.]MCW9081299.1 zf-TFIIB domain-containing protein [Colwellia sp.]
MICPRCQISLTVTSHFSIEVNDCPQCHGVWLEQDALEKIAEKIQAVEVSEKPQIENKEIEEKVQNPQEKKRGSRQFVSGALDIYDDW